FAVCLALIALVGSIPDISPFVFLFSMSGANGLPHSFPTRRSSDLEVDDHSRRACGAVGDAPRVDAADGVSAREGVKERSCGGGVDRKSTRLNSSHVKTSYAVFCLKKKKRAYAAAASARRRPRARPR